MRERTLLASIALFTELYNSQKDVYDVIAEFIKAAMAIENAKVFDATKATQMLTELFELEIPEAVVRTTLINRLTKKASLLRNENGLFYLEDANLLNDQAIAKEFDARIAKQDALFTRLIAYVEDQYRSLSETEKETLKHCFSDFLSGNSRQSVFLPFISTFVIENESDPILLSELDELREGLVLYDGVRHTPDLDSIGVWNEPLAIFLDPEHLFNAVGYNGQLYKSLFRDFYQLSLEIKTKGKRQISLWYSDSCRDEVDSFFYVAELILKGRMTPIPGKPAMIEIINGCRHPSDVLQKKQPSMRN